MHLQINFFQNVINIIYLKYLVSLSTFLSGIPLDGVYIFSFLPTLFSEQAYFPMHAFWQACCMHKTTWPPKEGKKAATLKGKH